MTPTNLLLIGLIILVLLLVYYFMGRKRAPIEIPQEIAVAALKPPKRPLEIFIDPNVGSRVKIVSLSTVEELDKVLDDIVEVNMADRNAINEEATKLEERIIADQKDNVQDLKTASEITVVEKKEELSASQKLLAEMMKRKEKKIQERELLLQKQRAAAYALDREKNRIENEKKLAEIKLKRQQVIESKKQATIKGEAERMNLAAENERLLLEARNKAEQDLIKTEEEAVEAEKMMREKSVQLAMEEAQAQEDLEAEREKYAELQMQYKLTRQAEQDKIDAAMEELDVMLEEETARKVKMEEEDERIRAEQKQKLLDANAAAVAELEEAEAEQERMDAEDVEMRRQFESESAIAENAQRASTSQSQAEYDAKIASDQALFDTQVSESERTGDVEQRAERQAATDLESQSLEDFNKLTEEEKERERVAATKLAEDSKAGGTTVPEGDNSSSNFDYDAYMRGEAIPCAVEAWGEWKKFGSLIEETETIVSGRQNQKREIQTGRWSQRWKRERKEIRPPLNGGRCVLEELKFTSQASKDCSESDWNPWKNVGDPYKQKRGNEWKWYVNQERDRATAVVADGCNLRTDTKRTELSAQNCRYSGWSAYRNITGAYEQTKSVRAGRGSVNKKTGKWVVKQQATRSILEQAKYGGTPCSNGGLTSTHEVVLNPVNCTMKGWGPWGGISDRIDRVCRSLGLRKGRSCTETHYARQKRTRGVHQHAAYGGAGCGSSEEIQETKRNPITCMRSWGAWYNDGGQKCTPGRGRGRTRIPRRCSQPQRRNATISRHPQYGAPACGSLTQTR